MQSVVVGDVVFDPRTGEVIRGEQVTRLRPHAAEAFSLLIEHAGQLVSRQQLCERIWPRGGVELDLGLNVCIRQIRVALGDEAEAPRYVETLRSRGYRLIAPVSAASDPDADIGGSPTGIPTDTRSFRIGLAALVLVTALVAAVLFWRTASTAPTRIAVLPFDSETLPDSIAILGGELAAGLTTRLALLNEGELAVIARSSSFAAAASTETPERVGTTLDADYLVRGSLRRSGSRFVLTAQLIDVASEAYVWSDRFVLSKPELLAVDGILAEAVLTTLGLPTTRLATTGAPAPLDPEGRMAFFGARFLLDQFTRTAAEDAGRILDRALASDSLQGPLLVERSRAYLTLGALAEAQETIDRARRVDQYVPGLDHAEARLALYGFRDTQRALDLLSRAVVLEPGVAELRHTYAQALAQAGALKEAALQGEAALDLDPLSATVRGDVGWIFYHARDFPRARQVCRSTLELRPSSTSARACLVLASFFAGELPAEASTAKELLVQLGGTEEEGEAVRSAFAEADIEPLARWLHQRGPGLGLDIVTRARALALLGEAADAADLIHRAAADPRAQLNHVIHDPVFDGIRNQPAYLAFLDARNST